MNIDSRKHPYNPFKGIIPPLREVRRVLGCFLLVIALPACSPHKEEKTFSFEKKGDEPPERVGGLASTRIELSNKGVGPVKFVQLGNIDPVLAKEGQGIFESKCTTCHKIGEKFIGPAPNGILKRRTPEWVMNMILNPEVMLKEDQLAKDLFMEFNGSPMSNQGLTEEQARAVLEFFRKLE